MNISSKTPDERVMTARSQKRPVSTDYISRIFTDYIELAGDRRQADDKSITGGIGLFHDRPVTIIGHRKGKTLEENVETRFGMPDPSGYRKAIRLMKQAEKFSRPVITFVDTPGAYPGIEAEAFGQGEAIASSIAEMTGLRVPVISVFIGEGGSGGALAIGVCDKMIMLENSIFSILSPEGFASILWKDSGKWKEACEVMKLTAPDLLELGICDVVIPEGEEGADRSQPYIYDAVEREIQTALRELDKKSGDALVRERYKRLRGVGKI